MNELQVLLSPQYYIQFIMRSNNVCFVYFMTIAVHAGFTVRNIVLFSPQV